MQVFISRHGAWLLPILAMLAITPFTPSLDMEISQHFYHKPEGFQQNSFYDFIFYYAAYPSLITCLFGIVILILSFKSSDKLKWRKPALILVFTMIIGSGLITNLLLKDHWGRPRPKQVIEFGGTQPFRPFYEPNFFNQPEPSKSFPSGHVTTGFYFLTLILIGKRLRNKKLIYAGYIVSFTLGCILAWTRIAQGGHFFSDTLMAALIMWLTAYACDYWLYRNGEDEYEGINQKAT